MTAPPVTVIHLSPRAEWPDGQVSCPYPECDFTRACETVPGQRHAIAEHLHAAHRVQIIFDRRDTSISELRDHLRRKSA